jgi:hypothetical protein
MGHTSILESSGFKINGDATNEHFLDDDGNGNVRLYRLENAIKIFVNSTQGTINYTTGEVVLNELYMTSLSNIDGASTTTFRITTQPASKDIIAVRNQLLEFNMSKTIVNVTADTFAESSGVGYTTTASNY